MSDEQPPVPALLLSFLSSYSRARRLEDRIRELCTRAVATSDLAELSPILEQLKAALRDHAHRMRHLPTLPQVPSDRRRDSK
jgi:hypothetical protein